MSAGRPLLYLARGSAEQPIIEGLRRGDVGSYRQLYELYAPRLTRTLERLFRDPQLAQDAVQSTFLAVFKSVHQFDGRSALLTWMTRIAIREGQRLAARQSRARRLEGELPEAETHSAAAGPGEREDLRILLSLLSELSVEKRTALLLFEVEGFSVQEIADITGEPRGTVLARLSRTRAELRESLRRRHEAVPALAAAAPLSSSGATAPAAHPRKIKHHV